MKTKSIFIAAFLLFLASFCFADFGQPVGNVNQNLNPQATVTPSPNNIPKAYSNGTIDFGWLEGGSAFQLNLGYVTPSQYSGSLQAAVTAGDTNVNGNYNLTSNVTVPAGSELWVSGTITQTGAFTLTINGPFKGSPGCFVGFSAGQIIGLSSVKPLYWGGDPSGVISPRKSSVRCGKGTF
jgi:hypothetical protein